MGRRGALRSAYASRIYGLGLVLLGNKTDAEDLVQDTFLKVWRKGASFDPQRGPLDAWILLNARSLAIDLLRRRTLEARSLSSGGWRSDVSDEPSPGVVRGAPRHDAAREERDGSAPARAAIGR